MSYDNFRHWLCHRWRVHHWQFVGIWRDPETRKDCEKYACLWCRATYTKPCVDVAPPFC